MGKVEHGQTDREGVAWPWWERALTMTVGQRMSAMASESTAGAMSGTAGDELAGELCSE